MLTKRGEGLSRREFVQIAGGTLAALGLSGALTPKLARALEKAAVMSRFPMTEIALGAIAVALRFRRG